MRIMGVDTGFDKEGSILNISIIEDGEIVSVNTIEVDCIDDNLGKMISKIFKDSNCKYFTMDKNGVNTHLYDKVSKNINQDELMCRFYKANDVSDMIVKLIDSKILNKIGMNLEYQKNVMGQFKFCDKEYGYPPFAMTTVYGIGVANKLYRELISHE